MLDDVILFEDAETTYFADACAPLDEATRAGEVALTALARGHYPGDRLADGVLPEVRTIGYWDAPVAQSWGLDWHRNEGIELTFLARGGVQFSVGADAWDLHAGQVTVTRPWQAHRVGAPHVSASQVHWLILDVGVRRPDQVWLWPDWLSLTTADLARLTVLLQQNECAVWQGSPQIAQSFQRAAQLVRDPVRPTFESQARIAISSILLELLCVLESNGPVLDDSPTAPRRGVAVFLDTLDARLGQPWTVDAMARACGMGRTQFTRHCQDLVNASPMEYLNTRRVLQAAGSSSIRPARSPRSRWPVASSRRSTSRPGSSASSASRRASTAPREVRHQPPDDRGRGGRGPRPSLRVSSKGDSVWLLFALP